MIIHLFYPLAKSRAIATFEKLIVAISYFQIYLD